LPNLRRPAEKIGPPQSQTTAALQRRNESNLREYALEQYQSNAAFRQRVDETYFLLKYEHSLRANNRNRSAVEDGGPAARQLMNLYDEPGALEELNRIGRTLMKHNDGEILYVFKSILHPVPLAESLSNGTIYLSTGLIAAARNESQLAYVLAHEIGHIQLDHWKNLLVEQLARSDFKSAQDAKTKFHCFESRAIGNCDRSRDHFERN
jgi:hypothetical protein